MEAALALSIPNHPVRLQALALADGWVLDTRINKWWRPASDDGSRYVNNERAFRYICEDHRLA